MIKITKEIREHMLDDLKGHLGLYSNPTPSETIKIETILSSCQKMEDKELVSVWNQSLSNDQKTWLLDEFDIGFEDLGL